MSRIIYICPSTKTVGLSVLQNVVENEAFSFQGFSIGDVVDDATVTRLDQGKGLLLQLSDNISGYAHVSSNIPATLRVEISGFGLVILNHYID